MSSQAAPLRHIEAERAVQTFSDLEEPGDLERERSGEDADGNPAVGNSGRTGRPRRTFPDKLRRRVSTVVADTHQRMHDEPNAILGALGIAIDDLERLAAEIQTYIEEEPQ